MTEVQNKKQFVFNFTDRKVNIRKADFSSSKAEQKIFEFFEQNSDRKNFIAHTNFFQRVKLLDFSDDAERVITEKEISEFLKKAKSQKTINIGNTKFDTKLLKDVTEEDLMQFFSKVLDLSPTHLQAEKLSTQSVLKDEQGNPVFTDEVLNNFPTFDTQQNTFNMVDHNGNIKPGHEIFDLNDDGKIDSIEKNVWGEDFNIAKLQEKSKQIAKEVGTDVLTPEVKHNYYNKHEAQFTENALKKIQEGSLKDAQNGTELITNEVKHLFSAERKEISIDDLVDENGRIKKGFELFDINNDGKIDELERNFYSNGGKFVNKGTNTITLENFVNALTQLDKFDAKEDNILTNKDKETLYLYTQGAYQMMDSLQEFPDEIRNLYEQALYSLSTLKINYDSSAGGTYCDKVIGLGGAGEKGENKDKFHLASVLFHELTHFICDKFSGEKKYHPIAQEVQCFYMQYKLQEKMENVPGYDKSKVYSPKEYNYLKKNNPEITELDIAKTLFRDKSLTTYQNRYNIKDPNILENSEYRDIGGIFSEPENKAQIYNTAIQKAFSGLSVKDENGKELITEELKNAFSADRPILILRDIEENGKIKPGFEIFDLDGDGKIGGNEKSYIDYVTYNDIPRLVAQLKRFNTEYNNDNGNVISSNARKQFAQTVLKYMPLTEEYNFHKAN